MSYKALYRKYRPKKFDDVVGQNHITKTLENIIQQDKVSHAYLFAGPRGTGKTTIANIFAREVNRNAVGEVKASVLDIIEIDAASNNGIAEIRSIIDGARYAPTESKYKVYIIDESHMLTKGAFNALLKTLEEPPSHVIFILATTEPEKMPVTVLSRLQRFNFRRINEKTIMSQLDIVLKNENITYDKEAIKYIAKLARGGMRDALSIADQSSAYGNNNISFLDIATVFGLVSTENQIKILNLIYMSKSKELLSLVSNFFDSGVDIERLTLSLIEIMKDFVIFIKTSDPNLVETVTVEEISKINISIGFAYEMIDEFMKLLSTLKFSELPRQAFEISLIKLVNFNNNVEKQFNENHIETREMNINLKDDATNFKSINNDLEFKTQDLFSPKIETNFGIENQEINKNKLNDEQNSSSLISEEYLENEATLNLEGKEELLKNKVISTLDESKEKFNNEQISGEFKDQDTIMNEMTSILETQKEETVLEAHQEKFNKEETSEASKDQDTTMNEITSILEGQKKEILEEPNDQNELVKEEPFYRKNTEEILMEAKTSKENEVNKESNEIDLLSMFEENSESNLSEEKNKELSNEEIINMLMQTNKSKLVSTKDKLLNIGIHVSEDPKTISYISLLQNMSLISVGKNFILLTSKNSNKVNELMDECNSVSFFKFIKSAFSVPLNVFAITYEKFNEIKNIYKQNVIKNTLPKPKEIKPPIIEEEKMSEEEKYGTRIFGDVFKK